MIPKNRATSRRTRPTRGSIREVLARGTPPGEVATRVVEAIGEDRFYIFSHPEWLEPTAERFQAILRQEPPVWSIPKRALEPR